MVPKAPVARTVVPVLPLSISARQRTGQNCTQRRQVPELRWTHRRCKHRLHNHRAPPAKLNAGDVMFPPVSERITGQLTEVSSSQQPATGTGETAGDQSTGHPPAFSPSPPPTIATASLAATNKQEMNTLNIAFAIFRIPAYVSSSPQGGHEQQARPGTPVRAKRELCSSPTMVVATTIPLLSSINIATVLT